MIRRLRERAQIKAAVAGTHWHQRWELAEGVVTPGGYEPEPLFDRLQLGDLTGKRVLDIGAADGYYSFRCEALGAEVVGG